jgi:LuxR family maltose regulon positive regulatory protein
MASQSMLERLERAGLFVMPLGEDRRWYRYHHLFRDLLLRRLVQPAGEAELCRLHGRASAWLANHDLVEDAIPHALASGDPTAAAELVGRHVQRALAQRRWTAVERWLGLLPPEQTRGRVGLLLVQAWVQRFRGQLDALTSTLDQVESLLEREAGTTDPATAERWRAEVVFFRQAYLSASDTQVQATLAAATRASEVIPWETHAAASSALLFAGGSRQMVGDMAGAVRVFARARAECAGRSDPFALHRAQCASFGLMVVWLSAGDLARCRRTAEELLALATAHGCGWGTAAARTYLSDAFLNLVLAQEMAGRRSDADATVNRYLDRLIASHATWDIPTVRSFQARLALARGAIAPALRWLRTSRVPRPGGFGHNFEIPPLTRAKVLLAEGSVAGLAEADSVLDGLLRHAEATHSLRLTIALLAHKALVQQARGRPHAALKMIGEALAIAEPRGFCRTFVDLGAPMATLLGLHVQQPTASPLAPRLIAAILTPPAADAATSPPAGRAAREASGGAAPALVDAPLVERLTERELDVLDGLAKRLSNKEIAEELAISPHTIKRHTTSIYGKLGVSSRRQAVRRALAAGLMPIG